MFIHLLVVLGQLSGGILAAGVIWCTYSRFFHPLARYPGPASARWGIPFWQFWHSWNEDYCWSLKALHDRHGPIVRIAPDHISFSTPSAASIIYAHGSDFHKTPFYHGIQVFPGRPSLFSDIDPATHAAKRRSVSAAYSMTSLVALEEYIEPVIDLLMERWDEAIERKGEKKTVEMDVSRWLHFFAMDAVGELAFGESFGFVSSGVDPSLFLTGVTNLSRWGSIAGHLPLLQTPIKRLLKHLSGLPGGEVVGHAGNQLVTKRFKAVEQMMDGGEFARRDMLDRFMKAKSPVTGGRLDYMETLTTALSVLGAGSDTTSVALSATLGHIIRNPSIYARVLSEIDTAFDSSTLALPIKYAASTTLPLLQACIKETLRLHPPVSMSLPRMVPPSGAVIDGRAFKAGTEVSVCPFVMHRTEEAYGVDAEVWRPDRWVGVGEEERRGLERCNMSFGAGARQCIGKNISLMEMGKILPTLLRTYHFSYDPHRVRTIPARDSDGTIEGKDIPWRVSSYWFAEIKDMVFEVSKRDV